ncbi:sulfite exporter TauE/SafE family protein [Aestuariibacter salexigens]|uniref:sulfite exporter TauE/SafE family protein n=1 Tax=Aestuariibacter salexigens TaxID=226010 RepID=UPI00042281A1|nr:sulfite exporter TauE/SafE family protein [Aestuariibacter salexigens]
MDAVLFIIAICAALGIIVGFLAGMLGIGGGLIIVPVLSYLLASVLPLDMSVAMPMAIATSLSTIILTGLSSSRAHFKLGNLNRFVVLWCASGIAVGAVIGAQLATRMPVELLKGTFAALVLVIASHMAFGGRKESKHEVNRGILLTIGLGTGIISAIMGIGGGALLVPALVWFRVNVRQAIGCAALCGLVIALFGTISFVIAGWQDPRFPDFSLGYVYLPASIGIVLTSMAMAGVGARVGQSMNTQLLKKIFALFLVIISVRMMLGIIQ